MSILRVSIHGSRRVAVLVVGLLGFPLEVLRPVVVVVVDLPLAQGGNVPGERIVLHHVLGRVGPEYLIKIFQVRGFRLLAQFTSVS